MPERSLYASLIGINAYPISELNGCIRDVLNIDLVLREYCREPGTTPVVYKPMYLLAPHLTDKEFIEEYQHEQKIQFDYHAPTFKNITTIAFDHLSSIQDGDICLLYYSGHGSQVEAPPEFWHSKPNRQSETIVCVDSRDSDNPDSRDLIDQELGFLIWKTIKHKNVHCLIIMDCCHSGNNMRAVLSEDVKYRFVPSSKNKISLQDYLGFDSEETFYETRDGKLEIKIARYVHLAGADESEKALETIGGGLFTNKLVAALRSGGTATSYRQLMQSLSTLIHIRSEKQNPVAFAMQEDDLDLQFLGEVRVPFQPNYLVAYDRKIAQWIMYGGAMHGILPSNNHAKTLIRITGSEKDISLKKVSATTSVLDQQIMSEFDKESDEYSAVIVQMANTVLKIGLARETADQPGMVGNLRHAFEKNKPVYVELLFEDSSYKPDFLVRITDDKKYIATKSDSTHPLFKREINAPKFINNLDAVGKWMHVSELRNMDSVFTGEDFVFQFEAIENQPVSIETLEGLMGKEMIVQPNQEIVLNYHGKQQPAFRFNISIHKNSQIQRCYIRALYLDNLYGIIPDMIDSDIGFSDHESSGVPLRIKLKENFYRTIPVKINKNYKLYGINEVTDLIKIFVSDQPINLDRYRQEALELDPEKTFKSVGLESEEDQAGDQINWAVFDFRIRIVGPDKEKALEPGVVADFHSFTIEVPEGFNAKAFVANSEDQYKKSKMTRSVDRKASGSLVGIRPSASIWGNVLTEEGAFERGLDSTIDNAVQVLELTSERDNESLVIPEGKSIVIRPSISSAKSRSIDDLEETIIPFGYNESLQLFFPVGYSDSGGTIFINQLPPASSGTLRDATRTTRSVGGSVKLFFKKIFRFKQINTLAIYGTDDSGSWALRSDDPAQIKEVVAGKSDGKILIIIHGITGDTKHILEGFCEKKSLHEKFDFVMTYDYENLSTPISKTAEQLKTDLERAGFIESGNYELTILAHSSGGLVARWFIEKLGGDKLVDHLIMTGAPNAGTELVDAGSSVVGLLSQALNVTGPIKWAITGLSFLMKNLELDPANTCKDLKPGSDLLRDLLLSKPPENIRYSILGGDISLLKNDYSGNDFFLQKLSFALKTGIVFPGLTKGIFKDRANDTAVTIQSMRAISGFDHIENMKVMACTHLGYFQEDSCQKELLQLLETKDMAT